jgi:putative transport protein
VEKPVGELGLEKLGAVVTRLRRGDIDLPVTHDTRLQLGDRVQVISYKDRERAVREFFGNSLTVFTETGYFSFAVGIILGLVLGQIPIPIPGLSQPVRLGVAGGPLVVALILGSRGRTGPFIWSIPAEVNLTLRHLGILFFLAAVGVKAGHGLLTHLQTDGWTILAVSVAVIATAHLALLAVLRFFGQRELATLLGVVSALQTQPAVLTKAPSRPLNTAYAATYPLAMILKIILAQVLLALA